MTGRRPTNSGMIPNLIRSSGSTSASKVPTLPSSLLFTVAPKPIPERSDRLRITLSKPSNAPPEVQGIGLHVKAVKQITLANNTSSATDTGIYLPGFNDKGVRIIYKINRGTTYRTVVFTISAAGEFCTFNDDFEEANGSAGITLSAKTSDGDSTAGNDTIRVQFTSTSTGTDATMEYQVQILV